jgi:hypothetical protein
MEHEHTSTGNSLAVALILDITAGEDTLDVGVAGTRLGNDVTFVIELDLALDEGIGGVVANSVEKTIGINDFLLVGNDILDTEVCHEAVRLLLAKNLGSNGVEADLALGVVEQTVRHNLRSTQLVLANENSNAAAVLGEEHGLLGSGVTAANDVQRLVAEDGHGTVADGTGADSVLPVGFLAGEVEAAGVGACGDNDGVRGADGLAAFVVVPLGPHLEGPGGKVELGDGLGDDLGAEALGLGAHVVHQLSAADALGEAGEVLHIGGGCELATGCGAVGEHALIENGLELGAREIDSGSVGTRAGADNCGGIRLGL